MISVIVNVVLNYALIKHVGLFGAAIATGITQGISLLISNLFFGEEGKKVFKWQMAGLNPINAFKK